MSPPTRNITQTDVSLLDAEGEPAGRDVPRGAAVGRYVILDRVGRGGMGVVYAAYDPELDRRLALKLLRNSADHERGSRRRHRIIREAQAMARLSHPNVITVHDVGTIDERVFFAMEFVDGFSLAEWNRRRRGWEEVLEVYAQAGRGLAAAHAARLVHRDFKPDNVMLARSGRVVVTDFGLARAAGDLPARQGPVRADDGVGPRRLATSVTEVGALVGTPAYMSPEQHEGAEVDARSDQFAFAVAFYESLYGQRPFAGDDVTTLAYHVSAGIVRAPSGRSSVPAWLRKVLLRALSVRPEDRFPSMDALLAALGASRPAHSRRWVWGTLALLGGALGVGAWLNLGGGEPCGVARDRIATMLDTAALQAPRQVFAREAEPSLAASWPAVVRALDDYNERWADASQRICTATHTLHVQSDAVLAVRRACLGRNLSYATALLAVTAHGDRSVMAGAVEGILALPDPAHCVAAIPAVDAEMLAVDHPLRARVEALQPEAAKVAALAATGASDSVGKARDFLGAARTVGYAPLVAEATLYVGALELAAGHAGAEADLRQSLLVGMERGVDDVAAGAGFLLLELLAEDPSRVGEARLLAEFLGALVTRRGRQEGERARLELAVASIELAAGDRPAAQASALAGLARLHATYSPEDLRTARASVVVGRALTVGGHWRAARDVQRKGVLTAAAQLGPAHPTMAGPLLALARVYLRLGDPDAARPLLGDARAAARAGGERHIEAEVLRALARVEQAQGLPQAATDRLLEALEVLGGDPAHAVDAAETHADLAALALMRERVATALRHVEAGKLRMRELDRRAHPSTHGRLAVLLGEARMQDGDRKAARAALTEALAVPGAQREPPAWEGRLYAALGELALAEGDPDAAISWLGRALAFTERANTYERARVEFSLARAYDERGGDLIDAPALARQAAARLESNAYKPPLAGAIAAWSGAPGVMPTGDDVTVTERVDVRSP